MTWQEFFVKHRNYFLQGRGEIAVFGTLGTYFALGAIYLQTFFPDNATAQTIFAVVLGLVFLGGSWAIGFFFDKWRIFHAMNDFGNQRNPFVERMDEMQKQILEIKELVKK